MTQRQQPVERSTEGAVKNHSKSASRVQQAELYVILDFITSALQSNKIRANSS